MPLDQTTGVTPRDVEIKSETGVLQGRLYLPAEPAKAAIVLNSATGVPQGYYKNFATWLAT
jgi:predicted alpha/beta hydrolase